MEMANEFPDALVTGIDMSPVFPTTIIPPNCRFVQHNILDPLPFPDNSFDFVYQRLLVAGLTPDDWTRVAKELERVTVPGGWIELVEVDGHGGNNGPNTAKIWGWVERALMSRGVNSLIGREPGLCKILEMGGATNVQQDVLRLPTGEHGGKIGQLLKENEQSFWNAMTPMIMHEVGVDKNEIEEAIEMADDEVEEYQSFHIFYVVTGQKRILVVDHDDDDNNHRLRPLTITTNTTATKTTTSTTTTNNNNNNTNTNNNTNSRSNHVNKPYRRLSPEQAAGASRGARGRGEP